jgi:hypothetical protein
MAERGEFRFEIKSGNPLTLSMKRLSAYPPHLVKVFGNEDDIHLLRIDEGSAVPCIFAKDRVVPNVQRRLVSIKAGNAGKEAMRAVDAINDLLSEDQTSATLRSPHFGIVIPFPGANRQVDAIVGPISQESEIQGELVQIGGRDETISMYIRNDTEEQICTASREQGIAFASYLFRQVRVYGDGRWSRDNFGRWRLNSLRVRDIKPLSGQSLVAIVDGIRDLHNGEWSIPPLEFVDSAIDEESSE